jgi:hypothetical protein
VKGCAPVRANARMRPHSGAEGAPRVVGQSPSPCDKTLAPEAKGHLTRSISLLEKITHALQQRGFGIGEIAASR